MADTRVLQVLADRFARSRAGRTGRGVRDFLIDYKELLTAAGCLTGDARTLAEVALAQADSRKGRGIAAASARPRDACSRWRIPLGREAELFTHGRRRRTRGKNARQLAADFHRAAITEVLPALGNRLASLLCALGRRCPRGPEHRPLFPVTTFRETPNSFPLAPPGCSGGAANRCCDLRVACSAATQNASVSCAQSCVASSPMSPAARLRMLPAIRHHRSPRALSLSTGRFACALRANGSTSGNSLDPSGSLRSTLRPPKPSRRQQHRAASRLKTTPPSTNWPKVAAVTCSFVRATPAPPLSGCLPLLPSALETWHFGDSDPAGFDILARPFASVQPAPFRSLHMQFRAAHDAPLLTPEEKRLTERLCDSPHLTAERSHLEQMLASGSKGNFEQESLGRPRLLRWPFYDSAL